jgi:heme-degrading monooxygenase HmoA
MILEIANIDIKPGCERDFEEAVSRARPIFARAAGCHGMALHRVVEKPRAYRLLVQWDSVEAHMVGFQGSSDFAAWRALVGPYFERTPTVEHGMPVVTSGG